MVILHGLMGSSRNWTSAAQHLAGAHEVFALDLRNHGHSPRHDRMDYEALCADLESWVEQQGWASFHLLGHSLGGKVAMRYACRHPGRLESLVVVDIAPKKYPPHYRGILQAMAALDLEDLPSRKEAGEALQAIVPDWALRQFLLTNLERANDGRWFWAAHLPVILEHLDTLSASPLREEDQSLTPSLFVRGDLSDFIRTTDASLIKNHFPRSRLITLPGAGHNPHVEKRDHFTKAVLSWREDDWSCDV